MGKPRLRVPPHRSSALRRVAWAVALLITGTTSALAQPEPEAAPAAATAPVMPALSHVVTEAAGSVAPRAAGAVVVGAPLKSDTPAPRGPALVSRLVGLVAGAIGPAARAVRNPMPLDAARAEAATSPALVYVQVEVANGELRLTVDAYPIPRNIWDRSRSGSPGPIAHGFGSARIDAEVRTFLAPIALIAANPVKVPLPTTEVMAMACEDIDNDGALELFLMSRRTLALGRVRNNQFVVLRQVAWQELSPIAPIPWRQPLATLSAGAPGLLDVGLTDRAQSVRLDAQLVKVAAYDDMPVPVPGGTVCAKRRVGSLTAELGPCLPQDHIASPNAAFHFDAVAAARVIGTGGDVRDVWAVRSPTDGSVALRDDHGKQHALQHVGAQLALADVDLDGDPDLVASKNVLNASNDALVIRSWRSNGTMEKRAELPVPDGISAVVVCPPDGPGQRTVAVATSKELWILR